MSESIQQGIYAAKQGHHRTAHAFFARAVGEDPNDGYALACLGGSQIECGLFDAARATLERAVEIGTNVIAHVNLSALELRSGNLGAALKHARKAECLSDDPLVHHNLGVALKDAGDIDGANDHLRLALKGGRIETMTAYLLTQNYRHDKTPEWIADEHRKRVFERNMSDIVRDWHEPHERLRVGYLSGDFRNHSVAHFIYPVLANHSERIEIYLYSTCPFADDVTAKIRTTQHTWRDCFGRSDEAIVAAILQDEIDVLVDLAGYTEGGRPRVFTMRAAPVQISYLGYPNTTGMKTMDFRIADSIADPDGSEGLYTEKLLRIPGGLLCYDPLGKAADVVPPPYLKNRYITFGCFNSLAKINEHVCEAWAEILRRVPNSRLYLKARGLDDEPVRAITAAKLNRAGVPLARVDVSDRLKSDRDHMAEYSKVDIALDTFPYNGTTTTCEALWMGVPVLTLAGDRHCGRVGEMIQSMCSAGVMAALSHAMYPVKAKGMVEGNLVGERFAARDEMLASSLMAGRRMANELELAYFEAVGRKWPRGGRK